MKRRKDKHVNIFLNHGTTQNLWPENCWGSGQTGHPFWQKKWKMLMLYWRITILSAFLSTAFVPFSLRHIASMQDQLGYGNAYKKFQVKYTLTSKVPHVVYGWVCFASLFILCSLYYIQGCTKTDQLYKKLVTWIFFCNIPHRDVHKISSSF